MIADFGDFLVWLIRVVLFSGICWGAWLCFGHFILPARSPKIVHFEHFATFALLVLLFSTLGGLIHAG
jgi:hypothetical protein